MGAPRKSRRRQKGTGTIRKRSKVRADGSKYIYYEGRYEAGIDKATGKRVQRSVTGKTEQEVKDKITKLIAARVTGQLPDPDKTAVGEWADEWITTFCKAGPSSVKNYRDYLRLYCTEGILTKSIQEVTAIEAQKWVNQLSLPKEKGGYKLAPKTVRNVVMFMKSMFEKAKDVGILTLNPFQVVTLPPMTEPISEEDNEGRKRQIPRR